MRVAKEERGKRSGPGIFQEIFKGLFGDVRALPIAG